ncbi:PREDICTED: uncharacterized protein LOC104598687 [Nelumbo nucifera]|uniref:Transmembrane protein n=2 Tax=Nelumbo nucifera TaxID=4432 RepID=A0A822ZS32_NELNU|nr:PREDICTED: uncharacterized protein LOC104598687 [Nelumbo nucifera]DAD47673.1 TPA_asm: hypothetical protein HUJ06_017610 [Nelumbo nucifera]
MHRSASATRVSDEFFIQHSSPPSSSKASQTHNVKTAFDDINEIPTYNPLSDAAKKEKQRIKFAENAVHVIPFVLLLCALILWFFSNPEVDMVHKDNSILSRVEGLIIDGSTDADESQIGLLSTMELDNLDPQKQMIDLKARRFLRNKVE